MGDDRGATDVVGDLGSTYSISQICEKSRKIFGNLSKEKRKNRLTFPAVCDNLLGMKENMNTKNLLKNFVTGNEPKRKTANLRWENGTLYSYGTWIVATIDRVKRLATVNCNKVSSTTSKHTNALAKVLADNQFSVTYTTKI